MFTKKSLFFSIHSLIIISLSFVLTACVLNQEKTDSTTSDISSPKLETSSSASDSEEMPTEISAQSTEFQTLQETNRMVAQSKPDQAIGLDTVHALSALHEAEQALENSENIHDERQKAYVNQLTQQQIQAALALYNAEKALREAEGERLANEMEHLSYLSKRQIDLADRIAKRKLAEMEKSTVLERQVQFLIQLGELEDDSYEKQLKAEREKVDELTSQLTELQSKQTELGLVVNFGEVFFNTDSADIPQEALFNLDKVVDFLRKNPTRHVLVECHTDNRGDEQYNLELSQKRADSVRYALIERGINPNRIIAKGYGETRPVASNDTEAGLQQNRRVEITILKQEDKTSAFPEQMGVN